MGRPGQRHRRRAPLQLLRISNPVDLDTVDLLEAIDQSCRERPLVGLDAMHGGFQRGTSHLRRATQVRQVFESAQQPREALVVLGAGLPTARTLITRRTNLVGTEPLEQFAPAVKDALVRALELVTRADE